MPVLMLHSPRPPHPITARSRPRWQLRLRAWCLRKLGARTLRDSSPRTGWLRGSAGGQHVKGQQTTAQQTTAELRRSLLPASARGLLELNLVFERARGKAARDAAKAGSLTAGN